MAAGLRKGKYHGRTTLKYAVQPFAEADRLLVAFPRLRAGASRPPVGFRRFLNEIPGHQLCLGADEHTFIGPQGRLDGLYTAVDLIAREAKALGVHRGRVICVGTSMGAVCAMMAGLLYGAGRIIVGAAPIRCGTALKKFVDKKSQHKSAAPELIALATSPRGGDPVEFLDGLVFDAARRCAAECRIDMLSSPTDYATPSMREFAEAAADNPLLQVHLHTANYSKHGDVGDAFFPFLRGVLAERRNEATILRASDLTGTSSERQTSVT